MCRLGICSRARDFLGMAPVFDPKNGDAGKSVGIDDSVNGLMENAASVEIRKKRGFPPPLGKLAP
jgi:hypothetical protein